MDPTQIFKINSDGTNLRQLTFSGTNAYPVWCPDGSKIAYVHSDDPTGHGDTDIWVMDSDGGNQRRLTHLGSAGSPTWSPDGSKIIFSHGSTPHIYIMNSNGSDIVQLTNSDGSETSAEVSPDGSWLVFQGRINGIRDIYKMKMPPIIAIIDIDPDTLNLKSNGEWITAYIELPEGYSVGAIDVPTILLNGTIGVDPAAPTQVGDYDVDSILDLMVKFDRAAVIEWLGTVDYNEDIGKTDEITLVITGKVAGTTFEGVDTVKVLSK